MLTYDGFGQAVHLAAGSLEPVSSLYSACLPSRLWQSFWVLILLLLFFAVSFAKTQV
jgi:hypothetical protein